MNIESDESQIVSKQRVSDHGEVYTSKKIVNAMLDLVKHETERIDSRFLEPACGSGNFLAEILQRKLNIVKSKYKRVQLEYELYSFLAVSSIYGIDILQDNVEICRNRLFEIFNTEYSALYKKKAKENFRNVIRFVLRLNIVHGDALTLKTCGTKPIPIEFSQWSLFNNMVLREVYSFEELQNGKDSSLENPLLYIQLSNGSGQLPAYNDLGQKPFVPTPLRKYPQTHYLEIADVEL